MFKWKKIIGVTVSLAERIIDDFCLIIFKIVQTTFETHHLIIVPLGVCLLNE